MPLIRDDEVVRIDLPAPGEWVEVKARLSAGDKNRIKKVTLGNAKMRPGDTPELAISDLLDGADFAALEVAIRGWSFPDPVTAENIRCLDEDSVEALKTRLNEMYERSDDEKKDSAASGATTSSGEDTRLTSLAG